MTNFDWLKVIESISSGYKESNIGWLLYGLVRSHRPTTCVEIGVLHGYSTIFIGAALKDNGFGHLCAFDLWEAYPYRHTERSKTWNNIIDAGLVDRVRLYAMEAKKVPDEYSGGRLIDFIHVDISNTGDTYQWAVESFSPLMRPGALLVMEGGTLERDQYEWMIEFDKPPVIPVLASLIGWNFFVFQPFPGLTIMRKME